MLERVDGVVLAVHDPEAAARTYEALFGAHLGGGREPSATLGADLWPLRIGTDLMRLARPTGAGPVADHLQRWGEGLLAAVVSASDIDGIVGRLVERGAAPDIEDTLVHVEPTSIHGLRTIVVPSVEREPTGVISFLYEVTHLVEDAEAATERWADLFGLDRTRFHPIHSERYGYRGTLTLFDPPARLDRIEVIHPHDRSKAMGRFFDRRGEGPYMFYMESGDMAALKERLDAAGARYAPSDDSVAPEGLFVHPSSTHGVLIGVSRTGLGWRWSGRPDLAGD
jgi:catechol 2,3-dioxygenase-like lactoylglutathione lyase family enzyme